MSDKLDIPDLYLNEYTKYKELFLIGETERLTIGSGSFTSSSSSVEYTYTDGDDLFKQLYNKATKTGALSDYIIIASEFNSKIENSDISPISNKINNNEKAINELLMIADIDSKISGNENLGKFYVEAGETFSYSSGNIDFTKAYCSSATQGETSVDVYEMLNGLITDFKVGQEVTLQNEEASENLIIQGISEPTINFTSAIKNNYSGEINIYRSNIIENVSDYSFGNFKSAIEYDKTGLVTIANGDYIDNTSHIGNGGRKKVRLDNGWFVCVAHDTTNSRLNFFKTDDKSTTWDALCYQSANVNDITLPTHYAICNIGNKIVLIYTNGSNFKVYGTTFDASTISNVDLSGTEIEIDSSQTAIKECSITSKDGEAHACWISKNITYSSKYNLRYATTTVGGTIWSSPTQISKSIVNDIKSPCITVVNNKIRIATMADDSRLLYFGEDIIDYDFLSSLDSVWGNKLIDSSGGGIWGSPCVVVDSNNNVHLVYISFSSNYRIFYRESQDDGDTWINTQLIASGSSANQLQPSITCDNNNIPHVLFERGVYLSPTQVGYVHKTGGTWSSVEEITNNSSGSIFTPQTCENYRFFEKPIAFWCNYDGGNRLEFYGNWKELEDINTLIETNIRLNITPKTDSQNLSSFIYYNDAVSNIISRTSVVDSIENEGYIDMDMYTNQIGVNLNECISLVNSKSQGDKITLKYEISRISASNDARFTKIYGGID